MARPRDPMSEFRVTTLRSGERTYANTRKWIIDPGSGKEKRCNRIWGFVDNALVFHPNASYLQLSESERKKLIFPDSWDMSMASGTAKRERGRPAHTGPDESRLYGSVWMMEELAERTGVRADLLKVFEDPQKVNDILTLAIYPYVTGDSYNHMEKWQAIEKYPAKAALTPATVTRIAQSITEADRMAFIRLRQERGEIEELYAVDSTTRSAYGNSLVDIRVGKKKEGGYGKQTVEVVVYSLTRHEPVYYTSFPGNMPDVRTLRTILTDLQHAGFRKAIIVTDRGYESLGNMTFCILHHQKFITASSVHQTHIKEKIVSMEFAGRGKPEGMRMLKKRDVYACQFTYEPEVSGPRGRKKKAKCLINLYYDPVTGAEEQRDFDRMLESQMDDLDVLREEGTPVETEDIKRFSRFFDIKLDPQTRIIVSYAKRAEKIADEELLFGFFANTTSGLKWNAEEALDRYRMRDEQEKYFTSMKTDFGIRTQRIWSEQAKTGRLFILFVGLILVSRLRYAWKTTELRTLFPTVRDMVLEMRNIRCTEHTGRGKSLSPFVGDQVAVCRNLGIDIPTGCEPGNPPRKVSGRKRGRPPKNRPAG